MQADEIKPGTIYALGRHRIACGDCRDQHLIDQLFEGIIPPLLVTDPPYCSGGFQESKRAKGSWGAITNDNLSTRGYAQLIRDALHSAAVEAAYVFTDWRQWTTLFDAVEGSNLCVRGMLVWDKVHPGMGGLWRTQHELICFATNQAVGRISGVPARSNVLQCKRIRTRHHAAEKPVELIQELLVGDAASPRGQCAVYDPFLGSGTTLLAAEEQQRTCYGVEIEPRFVAATIKRWEAMTGERAQECSHVA